MAIARVQKRGLLGGAKARAWLAGATLALMAGTVGVAQAQEVTLTVHHFLSAAAPAQTDFIQPWADRIEEQSEGRIAVEIFPSMSMGGTAPDLYSQVRDGFADIVWTVIGYTPGVFPRTEVFELPTVHGGSAVATNLAIQDLFEEHLAEDFTDVKPLLVHVHAGNALHMVSKPVAGMEDLQGTKLRTPTRTGAWMIEAWGAEPVGMPVPELPQALSRNVVDGALIPFEVVLPLKVQEMTEHSVQGHGGERFGTAVFLYAMNQDRYDDLPDDLKKVIDDNSMANLAEEIGQVWDNVETKAMAVVEEASEVTALSEEAQAAIDEAMAPVVERWVEEADGQGLNGQALVDNARQAIEQHEAGQGG